MRTSNTPTLAESAAAYAARGWPVFPIEPGHKNPLTPHGFKDATTDATQITEWWSKCPDANIGCVPGQTGHLVIDIDGPEGEANAQALGLLTGPTRTVTTSRGRHLWFKHPGGHIGNVVLAPHLDVRADEGYVLLPPSVHPTGARYTRSGKVADALALPEAVRAKIINGHRPLAAPIPDRIPEGQRNPILTSIAGSLRRPGLSKAAILAALEVDNRTRCDPPLDAAEVAQIAASVGRYAPAPQVLGSAKKAKEAPYFAYFARPELDAAAVYGLAGEFVRIVGPHSEADPAALLVQFLVAFGSCADRQSWFAVEADRHYLNLFALLVGETSKSRKGTSWGHVKNVFGMTDPTWTGCLRSGLSSGEGLIWEVHDPIEKLEPIKEKGRVIEYQEVIFDPGVTDKRLLVVEPEFASTLRVMTRDGNTLSAVVRQAWDHGSLRALAKTSPAKATGAHISIIGHITKDELRRELTQTDTANGFANRFLFVYCQRSKTLPEGGQLPDHAFDDVSRRLDEALALARGAGQLYRDDAARALWAEVYPDLSAGRGGLLGAATGRAEAQALRLATIYALLDRSVLVREPHLRAALALWDYCAASAAYVFGDTVGDPVADAILGALRRAAPDGLDRTGISAALGRHHSADDITRALDVLSKNGHATYTRETTDGRPREVWRIVGGTKEAKKGTTDE